LEVDTATNFGVPAVVVEGEVERRVEVMVSMELAVK